jgi:hypothetical protein
MIIYLAVPYSHASYKIREARFHAANKKAAELIKQGHIVISPISHSHPIADHLSNHNDSEFWCKQDEVFLNMADQMWVLKLPGWRKSKGIAHEKAMAKRLGKPVFDILP